MAQCTLDINHPHFKKMFAELSQGHPDAEGALATVKAKIEADVMSCHRCVQPTPRHPHLQNLIWKYDFAPPSLRSSGRKAWRLVVFAKDLASKPKCLVAMACYSKGDESQLTLKELARHLQAVQLELPTPLTYDVDVR